MKKQRFSWLVLCSVLPLAVLAGCGGDDEGDSAPAPSGTAGTSSTGGSGGQGGSKAGAGGSTAGTGGSTAGSGGSKAGAGGSTAGASGEAGASGSTAGGSGGGAHSGGTCCVPTDGQVGCDDKTIEACVCAQDDYCCTDSWDSVCVGEVLEFNCGAVCPGSCGADKDCTDPAKPVCDAGTCVAACKANDDCKGFDSICDTASGKCVECLASADCTGATAKVCAGNQCVECAANADCKAPTGICDTKAGECVECVASADCTADPSKKVCSSGVCAECEANTDCTADPNKKICNSGVCAACAKDADCGDATLVCGSQNTCVKASCCDPAEGQTGCSFDKAVETCVCAKDDYCCTTAWDSFCAKEIITFGCGTACPGTCVVDTDCVDKAKPICNTVNNTCVAPCKASSDCPSSAPTCDTATGKCIECAANADCKDATKPLCIDSICGECAASADCKDAAAPVCNTSTKACVGCLASTDCTDKTKPICDTKQNTCLECLGDTDCTDPLKPACNSGVCIPPPVPLCTSPADAASKGACAAPSVTSGKYKCNPITNEGCDAAAGEACDFGQDGFECYPAPNDAKVCEGCSSSVYCAATLTCLGDRCSRFCCDNSDCGADGICSKELTGLPDVGVCVAKPCTANTDCTDKAKPICSAGVCSECGADADCAANPTKKTCDLSTKTCAECVQNTDCKDPAKPVCGAGTCSECAANADCKDAAKPLCIANACAPEPTAVCDSPASAPSKGTCAAGKYTCNPITNEGCDVAAGEACDFGQSGFECYPAPNTVAMCGACGQATGDYCQGTMVCLFEKCTKFCCDDTDCGASGKCDKALTGLPDVGVCNGTK